MSFGSKLSARRKAKGWNQTQLAEMVGVSFQTVSCWERDEYLPETDKLSAITKALDISISVLLDEDQAEAPGWALRDRIFTEEHMYTFIKAAATTAGLHQTLKALPFAKEKHDGQLRDGPEKVPYINHPLTMACHVLAMDIKDDDILAALLLHDIVEECGISPDRLPANEAVRDTVDRVSHPWTDEDPSEAEKMKYYARIMESPSASFVKIVDRCNNLSMMAAGFSRKRMISYIMETEKYVLPLIEKLKDEQPRYSNALYLLKYQMLSIMESLKRLLV